eukprot:3554124-Pleurochrysis_carterae.AAC.1
MTPSLDIGEQSEQARSESDDERVERAKAKAGSDASENELRTGFTLPPSTRLQEAEHHTIIGSMWGRTKAGRSVREGPSAARESRGKSEGEGEGESEGKGEGEREGEGEGEG